MSGWDAVRSRWVELNEAWEGAIPYPYLDILGLATCATGVLIDAARVVDGFAVDAPGRFESAVDLDWMRQGGYVATPEEIRSQLERLASQKWLAKAGHLSAAQFTDIRLTKAGIEKADLRKFDSNRAILSRRFPEIDSWPADAIFAVCSASWAAGAAWKAPKFDAFCRMQNFHGAAIEIYLNDEHNSGLRPRNAANKLMMTNAAHVLEGDLDRDTLFYPATVTDTIVVVGGEEPGEA